MNLITSRSIERPEVVRWHHRIMEYSPPEDAKITVLLPCSARKPYSKSRSHRLFIKYIKKGAKEKVGLVHEVILTSPLGLVPRELENVYPAAHYDVPVTGHWSQEERDILHLLLEGYLKKAGGKVIAHVDGVYREICGQFDCILTKEQVLSPASLEDLEGKVSESLKEFKALSIDRRIEGLKRVCDFQFGKGAGKHLIKKGTKMKGYQIIYEGVQLGAVNPSTGLISLTLEGGKMLKEHGKRIVEVSFKPETNSIFSLGVAKAGSEIRPNDEVVVVYTGEVVGVGRANLSGEEMVKAKKGLAVKLRHRKR